MDIKKKDLSIELLKAFAALLVLNSHMDKMYGEYSFLGTGGAIGDALFFFCSGYTIFLGKISSFPNWYKKRLRRIYPTVMVLSLYRSTFFMDHHHFEINGDFGSGWFILCIFLYYVILYPIRRYMSNHLCLVFLASLLVVIFSYFTWFSNETALISIYGTTYFRWFHFFLFMLFGAICGKNAKTNDNNFLYILKCRGIITFMCLIVSVVFFYLIDYIANIFNNKLIELISLMPLFGICFFSWVICNNLEKFYNTKIALCFIFIGGLCLEIYLGQGIAFTTSLNYLFPLNIPIIFIAVIIVAYILRCFSRLLLQTFEKENYNFKEIIKPY